MSRASIVKFSQILHIAGYSGHRALQLLGYPRLTALASNVADTTIDIVGAKTRQHVQLGAAGSMSAIEPAQPGRDTLQLPAAQALTLYYSDSTVRRLAVPADTPVPAASQWPRPTFFPAAQAL